ncbi:MAG: endonuclease/exonuclease/phosphatase family protein [Candidatus Cryptobacteroides sp.]
MKRTIIILLIVLIPLALAVSYVFVLNNRPGKPEPMLQHEKEDIRIGALNINFLSFNNNASLTADVLLRSAMENELDVLLLQEYKSHWQLDEKAFSKLFKGEYKYVSIQGECACISRFPVKEHKRMKFDDLSDSFSDIVLTLPGDRNVEIMAVHLMTTGISGFASSGAPDTAMGLGMALTFMQNGDIRKNQAISLARRSGTVNRPLIVAGDFNCLPWSAPYRQINSAGLKDSFHDLGHGSGSTYRNLGNFARIDYIFYNDVFVCTDSRIIDNQISDHKMMVSTFRMVKQEEGE